MTYEEALYELKIKLPDYIQSEGMELTASSSFSCPNVSGHAHGDRNPSASWHEKEGTPLWSCFKCGVGGDIFNLATFIHPELPTNGHGFRYETVPFIAEKLGIEIDIEDTDVPDYIKHSLNAKVYMESHPITLDDLIGTKYGRTYSNELANKMLDLNILGKAEDVPRNTDNNPILVSANNGALLIPIIESGLYSGIIGRHYKKELIGSRKYQNSLKLPEQGIDYYSILNSSNGINAAKKSGRLYIFEGVFNTLAAVSYGIKNSIGLLGSKLTKTINDLKNLILDTKIREIIVILDKDQAGRDSSYLVGKEMFEMGIVILFYDFNEVGLTEDGKYPGLDYDQEISLHGETFIKDLTDTVNHMSFIEYIAKYKPNYMNDSNFSESSRYEMLVQDISTYGSPSMAMSYAKSLELISDGSMTANDYLPIVKQVLIDSSSPLMRKLDTLIRGAADKMNKSKTLESKQEVIDGISAASIKLKEQATIGIRNTAKRNITEILSDENSLVKKEYLTGYENMDRGTIYDRKLVITDSKLIGIAAKPSHGKSLLVRGMITYMMEAYKDDSIFIYYSLDDAKRITINWFLSGMSNIPFYKVAHPVSDEEKLRIKETKKLMFALFGESLIVYDKSDGGSTGAIKQTTQTIISEYSDKNIVIVNDNMFNVNDIARANDTSKRTSADTFIDIMKEFTTQGLTIFNTLETNKNVDGRLTERNIKETGSIDFRNDITFTMFNSYKEYGDQSKMIKEHADGTITPIIEVSLRKAKIGGAGETYFFELDGPTGILTPVVNQSDIDTWKAEMLTDRPRISNAQQSMYQRPSQFGNSKQFSGGAGNF